MTANFEPGPGALVRTVTSPVRLYSGSVWRRGGPWLWSSCRAANPHCCDTWHHSALRVLRPNPSPAARSHQQFCNNHSPTPSSRVWPSLSPLDIHHNWRTASRDACQCHIGPCSLLLSLAFSAVSGCAAQPAGGGRAVTSAAISNVREASGGRRECVGGGRASRRVAAESCKREAE